MDGPSERARDTPIHTCMIQGSRCRTSLRPLFRYSVARCARLASVYLTQCNRAFAAPGEGTEKIDSLSPSVRTLTKPTKTKYEADEHASCNSHEECSESAVRAWQAVRVCKRANVQTYMSVSLA
jgi:hypothetical protein